MWKALAPELPVEDVTESQAWYRDVLGFDIAFTWEETYGGVCSGPVRIHLCRADEPDAGHVCCIDVEDPDALHRRCVEAGARVVSPLEDKPWGTREFAVEDRDGHRLRIGRPLAEGAK